MRIDWLRIENWKNLRGFEIDFDESQLTTVLMGANATGKSNLMEAIVRIFRNLDLDEPPDFAYQIRYECRGKRVEIHANPRSTAIDSKNSRVLQIRVDGKDLSRKNYSTQREQILPTHVFAYYSGTKQRLERLFDKPLEDFYGATLKSEPRSMRRLF